MMSVKILKLLFLFHQFILILKDGNFDGFCQLSAIIFIFATYILTNITI